MEAAEAKVKTCTIDWRRLDTGLWRTSEGDIAAAYSAQSFPKVRVFHHEGRMYTNCGGYPDRMANGYPLIREAAYAGPEPQRIPGDAYYEGERVTYRGQVFRLGPPVRFVAADLTVEEWRWRLKVMYADGGLFAANKPYAQMLEEFRRAGTAPNEATAIALELQGSNPPTTQEEMRERLERERLGTPGTRQLKFEL